jgi:hypothetical protein
MTFRDLLRGPSPDIAAICAHLDALSPQLRLEETMALAGRYQALLYELAKGFRTVTLGDLAPDSTPPMTGVPNEGRNSLYLFTRFKKCFYRPDDPAVLGKELWGWNDSGALVNVTTGPGYYVAYDKGEGEVLIDYTRLPPRPPAGGPRILENSSRLSYFVFNNTKDILRRVSEHVTIGRASRGEKILDNWFVLCRPG